jgi:hypothetical protein
MTNEPGAMQPSTLVPVQFTYSNIIVVARPIGSAQSAQASVNACKFCYNQ